MIRVLLGVAAAAVLAVPVSPVAAERAPLATLAHGEFSATLSAGTTMTCSGFPTRTCTHTWDATSCDEAAADTDLFRRGCDVRTTTGTGATNETRGTANWTSSTGYICTTTNFGTTFRVTVLVRSVFFQPDVDVDLIVAQTNGVGTFEGSRTLANRTVVVRGTFQTPGHPKSGPCGSLAQPGSFQGSFEITTPV